MNDEDKKLLEQYRKRRYMVFAGWEYENNGGSGDLGNVFGTVEEAVAHAKSMKSYDWWEVYDILNEVVVAGRNV